jgi:hypothetical protein
VDWAFRGNISKPVNLLGCQISFEADLAIYYIYSGIWIALTIFTVFGMNLQGTQTELDIFQQPILSSGVHLHGHDSTCSQRTQQQAVRIGTSVIANSERFVGDEFVATSLYLNLDVGGALGSESHNIFTIAYDYFVKRALMVAKTILNPINPT